MRVQFSGQALKALQEAYKEAIKQPLPPLPLPIICSDFLAETQEERVQQAIRAMDVTTLQTKLPTTSPNQT